MGDASTLRPLLRALPLVLATGCAASRSGHAPELVFARMHEPSESADIVNPSVEDVSLLASSAATLNAGTKVSANTDANLSANVSASAPAATPWITGLYGLLDPQPIEPRPASRPWSDDPWMDIEPPVYTRHITGFYGATTVTDDNAQALDIDKERVYGLDFDQFWAPSGHGWECGINWASADGSFMGLDGRSRTREFYAGYRRTFLTQVHGVQPYLSLGVTYMQARMDLGPMNADDAAWGLYGRLGINWELSDRVRIGIDYRRVVGTEIDAFGLGIDSDHDQLAASIGWGF